ncbi:MAG: hypothetical protein ACI8PT_001867 [Gammaproteobacteria bacterium]
MLNRGLLIVRPGPGFISWALSLDDSGLAPDPRGEQTAYLVPQFEDDTEADQVLADAYLEIFESELCGWHTDEDEWPADRSLALFKRWFAVEMHSVVEDLCGYSIEDDEFEV